MPLYFVGRAQTGDLFVFDNAVSKPSRDSSLFLNISTARPRLFHNKVVRSLLREIKDPAKVAYALKKYAEADGRRILQHAFDSGWAESHFRRTTHCRRCARFLAADSCMPCPDCFGLVCPRCDACLCGWK